MVFSDYAKHRILVLQRWGNYPLTTSKLPRSDGIRPSWRGILKFLLRYKQNGTIGIRQDLLFIVSSEYFRAVFQTFRFRWTAKNRLKKTHETGTFYDPYRTSLKFLGVTLSNNLSWSEHINNICLRSKRQLGLIHRHFHAATRVARERLYVSTVLPYLDYCSLVWDPHQLKNIAKLNSVQAFASKVVLQNWSASRNDRLFTLNWISLHKRSQIQKLVMCHKIVRNTSLLPSSYFSSLPSVSQPLHHSHNMRQYAPSVKTDYYKLFFFPSVITVELASFLCSILSFFFLFQALSHQ